MENCYSVFKTNLDNKVIKKTPKKKSSKIKRLARSLSANRLSSKFTPDSLFTLKAHKTRGDCSTSILRTESIYDQQPVNSNYVQA